MCVNDCAAGAPSPFILRETSFHPDVKAFHLTRSLMSSNDDSTSSSSSWTHFAQVSLARVIVFAANNPTSFILTIFFCLTPLFLFTAFLSWKLKKAIEKDSRVSISNTAHHRFQEKRHKSKLLLNKTSKKEKIQ